ncbi:MAG: hypothetical protein PUC65_15305 [Clostridiales bacterium]|nr:hypothetical protein [Clostridiales bacterium]
MGPTLILCDCAKSGKICAVGTRNQDSGTKLRNIVQQRKIKETSDKQLCEKYGPVKKTAKKQMSVRGG